MRVFAEGLIVGLLLSALSSFAQQRVQEGYLVTTQGDTLRGVVRYDDWMVSPEAIFFKGEKDADFRAWSVKEASTLYVKENNELYVSRKVALQKIKNTTYISKPVIREWPVHVFMQVLLTGPGASLYRLADADEKTRFLIEKEGAIQELINNPYSISRNNQLFELKGDLYKQQLQALCQDAAAFHVLPPGYDERGFKRYFRKYNACFTGPTIVYEAPTNRLRFDLGLSAGTELSSTNLTRAYLPTFGAILRLSLPHNFYNRFFRLNLTATPGVNFKDGLTGISPIKATSGTAWRVALGGGSYFGKRAWRPYGYVTADLVRLNRIPQGGFSAALGISYQRRAGLEVGIIRTVLYRDPVENDVMAILGPRISAHYYLGFKRKRP